VTILNPPLGGCFLTQLVGGQTVNTGGLEKESRKKEEGDHKGNEYNKIMYAMAVVDCAG